MPHALVSGGAGFIGSHLCAALLDRGYSVTCVDNLLTGTAGNLDGIRNDPRLTFLSHDAAEPLPDLPTLDRIYHLASPASVPDYLSQPLATLSVNSRGTWSLLERARRDGARFLLPSTSEIYRDPAVHPRPETYGGHVHPHGPRRCSDQRKR